MAATNRSRLVTARSGLEEGPALQSWGVAALAAMMLGAANPAFAADEVATALFAGKCVGADRRQHRAARLSMALAWSAWH